MTVLDISRAALERARTRLGSDAAGVNWIEADVTGEWVAPPVDIWHDRAVFHFLTSPSGRAAYVRRVHEAVAGGGTVIISAFALDGPERCSGLPVMRHSAESLAAALGPEFALVHQVPEQHRTPAGATQSFVYASFRRRLAADSA